jgi:predicted TPR repeat methyltransferase
MGASRSSSDQLQRHWDKAYEDSGVTGVSWYQPKPSRSIEMIERLDIERDAAVVDVGAGASVLVDELLARGFEDLTVLDISATALSAVESRIGKHAPVTLLHEDVLSWAPDRRFDLWHDRAVFHFLVDEDDRAAYMTTLRSALSPFGAVVIGTFSVDGPEYCSGLPVARYSPDQLSRFLGPDFRVVEQSREEQVTPGGSTRPYTWVAARARS